MTTHHESQNSLQRSLNFLDRLCFDENFEFNHETLNSIVGETETEFLLSQKSDRQMLYRELVFDSITSTLLKTYTESLKFFDAKLRVTLFRWFLSTKPVMSRHYKDIANEFCDFIQSLKQNALLTKQQNIVRSVFDTHPFLFDLFLYEKSWHQLTFMPDASSFKSASPDLPLSDAKPVTNSALLLLKLDFDVHCFAEKKPTATCTHLVLVRDIASYKKMEFELNALSFTLLQNIQNNPQATLGETLDIFTKSTPDADIDKIQSDALGIIQTFISKGIILGFE